MLQLSFDFLSENIKNVGDPRIFYLNQAEGFFKVCICQNNDPLEWQIPLNLGWRKVNWQCAHELRVAQVGVICAFCCLQVNTGSQMLCCYCLCRVVTDAEISLVSRS